MDENLYKIPYVIAAKYASRDTVLYDDLVDAAFAGVVYALRAHDPERGATLHTFAFLTANCRAKSRLKANALHSRHLKRLAFQRGESYDHDFSALEKEELAARLLSSVSAAHRRSLELRVHGSVREAAAAQGVCEATERTQYRRAVQRAAECYIG